MGDVPEFDPRLAPGREKIRELAGDANVVPLSFTYVDDCETPVSALLKLREEGAAFLLESAERGQVGRWSFVGTDPHRILRWRQGVLTEYEGDAVSADADPIESFEAPDPYLGLRNYLGRYRVAGLPEGPELPPFTGGAVGLFGYDLVRAVEPLGEGKEDPLDLPDLALMITDVLLAFDHLYNRLTIIACAWLGDGQDPDEAWQAAAGKIEAVRERLRGPVPAEPGAGVEPVPEFSSNVSREEFEGGVERIIDYIYQGDVFQVVPSQRFSAKVGKSALSIYRGLRAINPSPYMYFVEFGDFEVAGTSPEPLIKVIGDRVEIKPIAGTAARGANEEEDREIADRLFNDPKERAEHVMLVDLARSDIGRDAVDGSVNVDEMMVIETYSHVMHIVSRVTGRLREDRDALDVLRSALPAGTLSGAPKVRAMQIIDEVEPVRRSLYGGAVGYIDWNGNIDTAIHIRTVIIKDGEVHVQAGGGTVADALPEREFQESVNKSKAMIRAVGMACENPDWA